MRFARIPFELSGDAPLRRARDPDRVSWRPADDDGEFAQLMMAAFSQSDDPRDRATVERYGEQAVAMAMLADARGGVTYSGDRSWWSLALFDGAPAGFVLPVVFTGEARDGLDEGTIYHIGVVPQHRGQGLGALLLARGSDALLRHGVWRISADTAIENEPMILIFERQGWQRREPVDVPFHPLPGLD
jgi:ribosomal protein S18 acetylase RimI-like enzyme